MECHYIGCLTHVPGGWYRAKLNIHEPQSNLIISVHFMTLLSVWSLHTNNPILISMAVLFILYLYNSTHYKHKHTANVVGPLSLVPKIGPDVSLGFLILKLVAITGMAKVSSLHRRLF